MSATPVDLSKLDCPPGGNWRIGQLSEPVLCFGNAVCGSIMFDGEGGWGAYDADDKEIEDSIPSASKAAQALISALGLSPAPAPDLDAQLAAMSDEARASFAEKYGWNKAAPAPASTFTEAEAALIAKKGFNEGRMFETMIRNHFGAVEPTPEQIITAALAAAKKGQ